MTAVGGLVTEPLCPLLLPQTEVRPLHVRSTVSCLISLTTVSLPPVYALVLSHVDVSQMPIYTNDTHAKVYLETPPIILMGKVRFGSVKIDNG